MDSSTDFRVGEASKRALAALREANGEKTAKELALIAGCSRPLIVLVSTQKKIPYKKLRAGRRTGAAWPKPFETQEPLVQIVTRPPAPLEPTITAESKEDRLKRMAARQLEEIFARQKRIWGDWV